MIVREESDSFVLVRQHEHDRIAGEFAGHWRERPRPTEPTLYAIANHDLAWQEIDGHVLWNEDTGRPHDFTDYPTGPKLLAYGGGLDLLESRSPYAAYLCSRHYAIIVSGSEGEEGEGFEESEARRRRRIEGGLTAEELDGSDHNLRLLRLCDGLSLFVCLNRPGQTDCPPPYPEGLWLGGTRYEFAWVDHETLRLDPNPFPEPFDVVVPYEEFGKDRRRIGRGSFVRRITC